MSNFRIVPWLVSRISGLCKVEATSLEDKSAKGKHKQIGKLVATPLATVKSIF